MNYNDLVQQIFPDIIKYPINSITPVIGKNKDSIIVSMFILGDDFMLQDFRENSEIETKISCTSKIEKAFKSLSIRFDFLFKTGHPVFECKFTNENLSVSKEILEALTKVNEFIVWVIDKEYKVLKVLHLDWDYEIHKNIINNIR